MFGKLPKELLNGFKVRLEEIQEKNKIFFEKKERVWKIKQNSIKQLKMVEDIASDINLISTVYGIGSNADLVTSSQKKNQLIKKLKSLDNNKDSIQIDMYGFDNDSLPKKMISMGISTLVENLRKLKKTIGRYKGKNTPEFLIVKFPKINFQNDWDIDTVSDNIKAHLEHVKDGGYVSWSAIFNDTHEALKNLKTTLKKIVKEEFDVDCELLKKVF